VILRIAWPWLLKRPMRNDCVRYEDWLLWHARVLSSPTLAS
jgi:hypothetical protein